MSSRPARNIDLSTAARQHDRSAPRPAGMGGVTQGGPAAHWEKAGDKGNVTAVGPGALALRNTRRVATLPTAGDRRHPRSTAPLVWVRGRAPWNPRSMPAQDHQSRRPLPTSIRRRPSPSHELGDRMSPVRFDKNAFSRALADLTRFLTHALTCPGLNCGSSIAPAGALARRRRIVPRAATVARGIANAFANATRQALSATCRSRPKRVKGGRRNGPGFHLAAAVKRKSAITELERKCRAAPGRPFFEFGWHIAQKSGASIGGGAIR